MNARKLKNLIDQNQPLITSGMVCYCYFNTEKCYRKPIDNLEQVELYTSYKSSEWWIEDGDLCLMKGRNW